MTMKNVTVVGAGTMGNGIAHVFAQFGYAVTLNDVKDELVDRGLKTIAGNIDRQIKKGTLTEADKSRILGGIGRSTDLRAAVSKADLVVEAATENREVKMEIFRTVQGETGCRES